MTEIDQAFMRSLALAAAAQTVPRFRQGGAVDNKDDAGFDPVTEADREAENSIRTLIELHFPNHCVLGEENGASGGPSPYRWVIDPVDGTRAFICGIPTWTTLVGLEQDGVPIAGMIDQPITGERWLGLSGTGAILETARGTRPIRTSDCPTLEQAKIMVTDLRPHAYMNPAEAAAVTALAERCKLLRMGLDSYGFGLVAAGHMDLVIEAGLSWYDIAAVIPVIEAAGGTVIDWTGAPVRDGFDRGRVIVAANAALADQAQQFLAETLGERP